MSYETLCTPEIIEKFAKATELGLSLRGASAVAGIHRRTAQRWIEWAAAGKGEPFATFAYEYDLAQSRFEAAELQKMEIAACHAPANDAIKLAQWKLERRLPDDWGKRDTLRLEQAESLDDEALVARLCSTVGQLPASAPGRRELYEQLRQDYESAALAADYEVAV